MSTSISTSRHPVPIVYRIFFNYIEPVLLLSAIYSMNVTPASFVASQLPSPTDVDSINITPAFQLIMTQMSSLYFFFFFIVGIMLNQTQDMKVWTTAIWGMLFVDVGHVYALSVPRPEGVEYCWRLDLWNGEDAVMWGINYFYFMLRAGFLMGVGF